jgi:hypothetical protein
MRVRILPEYIQALRDQTLTPEGFAKLTAKLELVPDESAPYIAEDGDGNQYNYASHEYPLERGWGKGVIDWLGNPTLRD